MMDRAYITLPSFGSGFFSNYYCVLSMIITAEQMKLEPWVDLRQSAFVEGYNPYHDANPPANPENPWDWWFEQKPLSSNNRLITIPYNTSNFIQQTRLWKRADIPLAREINDKHIRIKKHILDRVESIYESEFKGRTMLGVMARGTEMNHIHPEYGDQTINTWVEITRKTLKKHNNIDRIFVVTEDANYLPYFSKNFENIFFIENVFRRTDEPLDYTIRYPLWPCLDSKRPNHRRLIGEETLIQALLLSRCDYLICKQCGVSSAAIFFSNNLKEVYYAPANKPFIRRAINKIFRPLRRRLFS